MKATGIVRKIDSLGRIVLPKELRDTIQAKPHDNFEMFVGDNGQVVLQKYEPDCIFCGSTDDVHNYMDKKICHKCVNNIQKVHR